MDETQKLEELEKESVWNLYRTFKDQGKGKLGFVQNKEGKIEYFLTKCGDME